MDPGVTVFEPEAKKVARSTAGWLATPILAPVTTDIGDVSVQSDSRELLVGRTEMSCQTPKCWWMKNKYSISREAMHPDIPAWVPTSTLR